MSRDGLTGCLPFTRFFHGGISRALAALLITLPCTQLPVFAVPVALPSLNADPNQTSVSGLSGGGFMAVQFSVAYSSIVKGAGIIAGGPYFCAHGDAGIATTVCSCTNPWIFSSCSVAPGATGVAALVGVTDRDAAHGTIDPVSGIAQQRIWMFSGGADSIVPPPVMDDLRTYYGHYVPAAQIAYRKDPRAQHTMPTNSYGNDCATLGSPFISKCGVDAAGELLAWIYGPSLAPKNTATLHGRFVEFVQSEFAADPAHPPKGMATTGTAYIPAACESGQLPACRLHIAFHGCAQDAASVGDRYVRHAGYNAWADTNRIIMLYPQAAPSGNNPKACWNWFDFDHDDSGYATKRGHEMAAVRNMIDRVAGVTSPAAPECVTASNSKHMEAGRAHSTLFFAVRADGSDDYMGWEAIAGTTTLRRVAPGYYVVGGC